MRDRSGVLMLMYDLPVKTSPQRGAYNRFRKQLLQEGFMQLQESVYVRLYHNYTSMTPEIMRLKSSAPRGGNIQLLPLSLAVFRSIVTITGDGFDMSSFADDILWI